jgi:hypothetical protein
VHNAGQALEEKEEDWVDFFVFVALSVDGSPFFFLLAKPAANGVHNARLFNLFRQLGLCLHVQENQSRCLEIVLIEVPFFMQQDLEALKRPIEGITENLDQRGHQRCSCCSLRTINEHIRLAPNQVSRSLKRFFQYILNMTDPVGFGKLRQVVLVKGIKLLLSQVC